MKKEKDLKTRFLQIYCDLPLGLRNDIICVDKKWGPMTWNVCYLEINADTKMSKVILHSLNRMELI